MNTQEAKRTIPPAIKRAVRQRCGFGCVICGLPLYEYEHMLGWANVQRHVADEMTLLCDRHHREKTAGLLPETDVAAANSDPHNRRRGASAPLDLHYAGDTCRLTIGGNEMTASFGGDMAPVVIDGNPLVFFRFEDGHYLLNCALFSVSNELLLQIVDNELVYSVEPWDIEWIGTRLVIRTASRKIFVDLRFDPPNHVAIDRGRLLFNGVELLVRPEYILVVNNTTLMRGCGAHNCIVGLNIGVDLQNLPSGIRIAGVPRYEVDRTAALAWARDKVGLTEADDDLPGSMPRID